MPILRIIAVALLAVGMAGAADAQDKIVAKLDDEGLHRQEWFLQSFLVLAEDLAEATAAGKRFAIFWEQANCPYCRDMHEINLADPVVNRWIDANFAVLQLNLFGSRQVTDFDGETLSESALARKYRINFTPTIQFFPERPEEVGATGMDGEAFRMPGYFRPLHFITAFEFVKNKRYADIDFQRYLSERVAAVREKGRNIAHPLD